MTTKITPEQIEELSRLESELKDAQKLLIESLNENEELTKHISEQVS